MRKIVLGLIRFYQKTKPFHIEPLTRLFLTDNACRFSPTCSEYTYEAVQKYGALKGTWMGLKRIVRCNPWSKGGFDPVI